MSILTALHNKTTFIFDFFHTLTELESKWGNFPWTSDYLGIDRTAWGEQIQKHSEDRLKGRITDSFQILRQLVDNIDPSIPDAKIREVSNFRIKRFEYAVMNIPENVQNTLSVLKLKGKKIGLITNADFTELAAWDHCPIAQYFNCVILSFKVGLMKPEKEIYKLCLRSIGSSAAESVFIGDGGSNELEGAKKCGLTTIMVAGIVREFLSEDKIELRKRNADYVVEFVNEML